MALINFTTYDQASGYLQGLDQQMVDNIFSVFFNGTPIQGTLKTATDPAQVQNAYTSYGTETVTNVRNALIVFNNGQSSGGTNVGEGTTSSTGKIFTSFDTTSDIIKNSTRKVTEAIWSTGQGILTNFYTSSVQPKSNFYKSVYHLNPDTDNKALTQFDITFGSKTGLYGDLIDSGSSDSSLTTSKAVYYQFLNLLAGTESTSLNNLTEFYVLDFSRNRLKQNLDAGNWELSLFSEVDSLTYTYIDNSRESTETLQTEGGIVYNIVSGSMSNGVYDSNILGYMYPEHGILLFNANRFNDENRDNYLITNTSPLTNELFLHLIQSGSSFKARNEQKLSSTYYFCRIKNTEYNFSNNPSFTTGSLGDFRYTEMINNPTVYFTSIGLYNNQNELLAVAKISKPIQKTFQKEANVKIRLDW